MKTQTKGLSIATKLFLALSAIAMVMLVTAIISVLEYRKMSNYVTDEIGKDISCINASEALETAADRYNHQILATVGSADSLTAVTNFDRKALADTCVRAFEVLMEEENLPVLDSLANAFNAYIVESEGLETIVRSDFIDSRQWFFDSLQPAFNKFADLLDLYNLQVNEDLLVKADDFQMGYYRSLVPVLVSVLVGMILIAMFFFFMIVNYVRPLYKMLKGIDEYNNRGIKYHFNFDGDDQLEELNSEITMVVEENIELKKRVKDLKGENKE